MFLYTPASLNPKKNAPLVVVLHGCLQCASSVGKQTGWNQLAEEQGFYVLYPQQRILNNPERCFKWYKRKHIYKNRGENASIKKMVDFMKANHTIDSSQVFITGLSAGAAMSTIMMADYPETFKAGAVFAGAPFKVATSSIPAMMAFFGWRVKTPEKWGSYVFRENKGYSGNYPKMIVYHGESDWIVNPRNGRETMKQWTNVHGLSTVPTEDISGFLGNELITRKAYANASGTEKVVYYTVKSMSHALPVDPGTCPTQGGRKGVFSKDIDFNSTRWVAYDMGLLPMPLIHGPASVNNDQEIQLSVPEEAGAVYEWHFPNDCVLLSGQNSASITLKWGKNNGVVNVSKRSANGCSMAFKSHFITTASAAK